MGDLSEHFSRSEFACRCCGELVVDPVLIDALERLRGLAADVEVPGLTLQQMYGLALQVPALFDGGIGVYDGGFLHVDVRPHAARLAPVRREYVGIPHLVKEVLVLLAKTQAVSEQA